MTMTTSSSSKPPPPGRILVFTLLSAALASLVLLRRQWFQLVEITTGGERDDSDDGRHVVVAAVAVESRTNPPDSLTQQQQQSLRQSQSHSQPAIAWLLSFPNSGTSYTLALLESASNRSIASNYGLEFSNRHYVEPVPIDPNYPDGPFWEGPESDIRFGSTVRALPETFVLTKTHCGGRCVKCGATKYLQKSPLEFLQACQRTSFKRRIRRTVRRRRIPEQAASRKDQDSKTWQSQEEQIDGEEVEEEEEIIERQEGMIAPDRVLRAVHLIRNPLHNVVSRFHLEARHMNKKLQKKMERNNTPKNLDGNNNNANSQSSSSGSEDQNSHNDGGGSSGFLPLNATGFRQYCARLDRLFPFKEEVNHVWNVLIDDNANNDDDSHHHSVVNQTTTMGFSWAKSKYQPTDPRELQRWLERIPCRAEFIKYVQWHNHVVHHVLPALGPSTTTGAGGAAASTTMVPVYTLYYEDYGHNLPHITQDVLDFLHLPNTIAAAVDHNHKNESSSSQYRPFRSSSYEDHYQVDEKQAIAWLLRALATPETWRRIRHYVREYL